MGCSRLIGCVCGDGFIALRVGGCDFVVFEKNLETLPVYIY